MRVSLSNTRKSRVKEKPQRRISKSQGDSARWALTAARWRISAGRRPRRKRQRRATDVQVLENAERLITAWNERQAKRMPMLFSPTIGAAVAAGYWFLWVRCPACRTTNAIDLRTLDRHRDAALGAGTSAAVRSRSAGSATLAAHDLNFRYLLKRDSRASWICPMSYSFLPFFDWHG
jgi:hypothetical protein